MEPRAEKRDPGQGADPALRLAAIGVAVTARGDPDAGAILLKLIGRDAGVTVLAQARRPDGTAVWLRATGPEPVAEPDADAYIARSADATPICGSSRSRAPRSKPCSTCRS